MSKARKLLEMLKTEQNTPKMREKVLTAARKYFRKNKGINAFFEHGQWWVGLDNGAQYSVVDAEGGPAVNGFDFEMVTEPDED